MIKSIDQLKVTLLNLSDTERLERHAQVEIAFAERQDKINMLEKALKQSQLECAGVRSQMKELEKSHKRDMAQFDKIFEGQQ